MGKDLVQTSGKGSTTIQGKEEGGGMKVALMQRGEELITK